MTTRSTYLGLRVMNSQMNWITPTLWSSAIVIKRSFVPWRGFDSRWLGDETKTNTKSNLRVPKYNPSESKWKPSNHQKQEIAAGFNQKVSEYLERSGEGDHFIHKMLTPGKCILTVNKNSHDSGRIRFPNWYRKFRTWQNRKRSRLMWWWIASKSAYLV